MSDRDAKRSSASVTRSLISRSRSRSRSRGEEYIPAAVEGRDAPAPPNEARTLDANRSALEPPVPGRLLVDVDALRPGERWNTLRCGSSDDVPTPSRLRGRYGCSRIESKSGLSAGRKPDGRLIRAAFTSRTLPLGPFPLVRCFVGEGG